MGTDDDKIDPKALREQRDKELYAAGAERGYDERDDELEDEGGLDEKVDPREQSMIFYEFSKPERTRKGQTRQRFVRSIGTTFYEDKFKPIMELYHEINSVRGWLVDYFTRLTQADEEEPDDPAFNCWSRKKMYGWKIGNEAYEENINTQYSDQDIDSFSRRSENGNFLREITMQRRIVERKKDGIIDGLVKK